MTTLSVLLDAGAGMRWRYCDPVTGLTYSKSEGLAVASLHAFDAGAFGHGAATATALQALSPADLAGHFQAGAGNPLVGVEGRAALLNRLGQTITARGHGFERGERLAELFDHIAARAEGTELPAATLLAELLRGLGPIWPARHRLAGRDLGDTWPHYALEGAHNPAPGWVPFHKLSQWLSYSLLEVFEDAGFTVTGLDDLTGLPEYRNGGLLLDTGALVPRAPEALAQTWRADATWVVEWRALTVASVDRIAAELRRRRGLSARELPLAKVLEGGTWAAGRAIAQERRGDGGPPFAIESDGTVF